MSESHDNLGSVVNSGNSEATDCICRYWDVWEDSDLLFEERRTDPPLNGDRIMLNQLDYVIEAIEQDKRDPQRYEIDVRLYFDWEES